MSYLIKWDNAEKTVIFQQYTDQPVKDDLYHLAEESAKMLKNVSHTVHLIIDERNIKMTLSSADIQYLNENVPENQGAVVMVVDKSGLAYKRVMQDVGKTIAPKVFEQPHFASTIEEARQLLTESFGVQYP
ncbi:MAG: hypothetical protein GC179_09540 [Anaerolineaceae bacterium]|nr:hypothetical protein [Anaerolineaceae bacterium]